MEYEINRDDVVDLLEFYDSDDWAGFVIQMDKALLKQKISPEGHKFITDIGHLMGVLKEQTKTEYSVYANVTIEKILVVKAGSEQEAKDKAEDEFNESIEGWDGSNECEIDDEEYSIVCDVHGAEER